MANLPTVIKFFAPVVDVTVNALMQAVDQKMRQGQSEFILLISCPGGSVFHGLSAYNYLKGVPARFISHNFGRWILSAQSSTALEIYACQCHKHGFSCMA